MLNLRNTYVHKNVTKQYKMINVNRCFRVLQIQAVLAGESWTMATKG